MRCPAKAKGGAGPLRQVQTMLQQAMVALTAGVKTLAEAMAVLGLVAGEDAETA